MYQTILLIFPIYKTNSQGIQSYNNDKARFPTKRTMALSRLGLPRHYKIHRRKQLLLPALDQTISSYS